jgi:hypothetical protein
MPHQRLPVLADVGGAGFERFVERGGLRALCLPAHAREVGPRRGRREVGDARQMHAGRARDLRQVHGAELARADQADADGTVFIGALLELGVEAHKGR